jgi:hypothetical protein
MGSAIKKLKSDHDMILSILKACRDSDVNSAEAIKRCRDLHTLLLDHLKEEDSIVYAALRDAASKNKHLTVLLEEYDDDLLEITIAAKEFFSSIGVENLKKIDYIREYGTFFMLLKERMDKEETDIYPEYERLAV